jgi:16S rRNA (uracil1498-N3)-methyltransferase
MGLPRFFSSSPLPAPEQDMGASFVLNTQVAHHAIKVLRLREGDDLYLFDGRGGQWQARIEKGEKSAVRLVQHEPGPPPSPLPCVLVQALAVADKMDWVIQKAVELGISAIQPLQTARCVLRLAENRADRKQAHWQQVAIAACEQSGRCEVPPILPTVHFSAFLEHIPPAQIWMLAPGAPNALPDTLPQGPLHILVGPEGGWSPDELEHAHRQGVRLLGLGPRVLRTETAGLALLSVLQARFGDFFDPVIKAPRSP